MDDGIARPHEVVSILTTKLDMPVRHTLTYLNSMLKLSNVDPRLAVLARTVKKLDKTYLSYAKIISLVESFILMNKRCLSEVQVAEFGVGRGGSALILGWLVGHYGGDLILFDTFRRIPPPSEKDGNRAGARYDDILSNEHQDYYGNVLNLRKLVENELDTVCPPAQIHIVEGMYAETLSHYSRRKHLDLAHIDCDWYESTKEVLTYLRNRISPEAILQVDDYGYWPGAKLAVDESDWLSGKRKMIDDALRIDMQASDD